MIIIIAAIGENFELAKDNEMLWQLPDDYNRFKSITLHYPVVMGRKSVDTMPDVLIDRMPIVITRNQDYQKEGVIVSHNIEDAISQASKYEKDIFIIGGGEIYHLGLPYCQKMYLTRVHGNFPEANVFFPHFSTNDWELISTEKHATDSQHAFSFTYETW